MKSDVEVLALNISEYCKGLREKNKAMKLVHHSSAPWRSLNQCINLYYIHQTSSESLDDDMKSLNMCIQQAGCYSYIDLGEYAPADPKEKYHFIKKVKRGVGKPA